MADEGRTAAPTADLQVGLTFQPEAGPSEEVCRLADEGPWDYLSCGEHLMFHGPASNGIVSLSWAAGLTRRVRLLTSVTLV
ncbi:MAG TPA: hypothetical protein VE152_01740, partial [Acidimicrobiales bacterium]|nr:hypothetical protein [Acidimicrobiales bacterium]